MAELRLEIDIKTLRVSDLLDLASEERASLLAIPTWF
jgi:hypothetical protein